MSKTLKNEYCATKQGREWPPGEEGRDGVCTLPSLAASQQDLPFLGFDFTN